MKLALVYLTDLFGSGSIVMGYESANRISCRKARSMFDSYMLNNASLETQDRRDFDMHIWNCPKCARAYDQAREFLDCLLHCYAYEKGLDLSQITITLAKRRMTAQESWMDLTRRIPELAGYKRAKYSARFRWAASVAACFVIGTVLCWLSWNTQTDKDVKSVAVSEVSPSEPTLAADNSVGGLESPQTEDDGPPTAVVKKDKDLDDANT